MDHPFFDASEFPFHRNESKALLRNLCIIAPNPAAIRLIYKEIGPNLPLLTWSERADIMWSEAMEKITPYGFFSSFISYLKTRHATVKALMDVIELIENAIPARDERFFSDDIFILDLKLQRPTIDKTTADSTMANVLLVRGKSGSGKSHCRFIYENVSKERQAKVVYIYGGMCPDVKSTIEYIYGSLGIDPIHIPPRDATSNEAWYKSICIDLKKVATQITDKTGKLVKMWIAMDDLGYEDAPDENGTMRPAPIIDSEIRSFFEQFALFTFDASFARHFRLMLINYAEPKIPSKWKANSWLEITTDENAIQQPDVEDFIKYWLRARKKTMLDPEISQLAVAIIAAADHPSPDMAVFPRLQRIHDILRSRLEQLS
ncbi:hypothetical protein [Chitinophaga pinensis]|uniref:Uncharacterized protein n=1 Tax=Chitinophaga pinensis (strain ATCC 43595 / DSM 2588 / LMG 13176 / NBRC 15968 / NCIMB 11800 / UQM 2034) TaxID=485918 RepID=A0A979G578_CHIPD|nr:hypothetical protein [Chitinophaga pinensis]ACU60938.1 hypothetical protein Cpin_3471 [Chitinophaga pinensis DSM 2588]